MKMMNELINLVSEVLECVTERKLVSGKLGNGVLQPIGIGFGSSGLCHGSNSMRAPNC